MAACQELCTTAANPTDSTTSITSKPGIRTSTCFAQNNKEGETLMRGKNALRAVWGLMALTSVACSTESGSRIATQSSAETTDSIPATDGAPAPAHATEPYHFETLQAMVSASDAVIEGRVVAVDRGDMVGDSEGFRLQLREVAIEVDNILHGAADGTFLLYELGWGSNGQPIEANEVRASGLGDRGLYFLQRARPGGAPVEPGSFTLINSQGRYLQEDGDQLVPANSQDELSRELAGRGIGRLKADIATASERAGVVQTPN